MTGRRFASRFPRDTRGLAGALIAAAVLVAGALPMAGAAGRVTYRVGEAPPAEAGRLLPLYRGTRTRVTVERPSVERCDRVEPGAGVSVPGGRLERAPGRLAFEAVVDAGAPLGSRDLKLRYAIELAGPEVVPARVLRGGLVEGVEPRRVVSGRPVVLTFSGRDLGNADVLASGAYEDARVLPGGTETRCLVQVTFPKEGVFRVALYDRDGPPLPAAPGQALGGHPTRSGGLVEVVREGGRP